jgi:hypothetical protein
MPIFGAVFSRRRWAFAQRRESVKQETTALPQQPSSKPSSTALYPAASPRCPAVRAARSPAPSLQPHPPSRSGYSASTFPRAAPAPRQPAADMPGAARSSADSLPAHPPDSKRKPHRPQSGSAVAAESDHPAPKTTRQNRTLEPSPWLRSVFSPLHHIRLDRFIAAEYICFSIYVIAERNRIPKEPSWT